MAYSDNRKPFTATIGAGGSVSAAVALGGYKAAGIVLPATGAGDFDANTARIQFQVSTDGTTYKTLRDNDGTLVQLTVAANNTLGATHLSPDKFAPWLFIKVCTFQADGATAQTQTAATSFTIVGVAP